MAERRGDPALDSALQAIAPDGVLTGSRRIDGTDIRFLKPQEEEAIARSVDKRRREFATGRVLLRELIGSDDPILVAPDRAALLPAGVVASLAHDHAFAVAAVTRATDLLLGIDIEPATPLAPDVAALVLRADEDNLDAHLAFTLKEAVYKAWSRAGGRFLDHHEVRLDVGRDSFRADLIADDVHLGGRYARAGDRWVALVVTSRNSLSRPARG